LVFFETPHRLQAALCDLVDVLGGDRNIAICRELTKLHEEIWRGTLNEARQEWGQRALRGEFTLIVAGAGPPPAWDEAKVKATLQEMIDSGVTSKEAIRQATDRSGWSKRAVYAVAQKIKDR
jgi:16S rRNA (cytidine1402-2'-O)-methyltransferase